MSEDIIRLLLGDSLDDDVIEMCIKDFSAIADTPLTQLGVTSIGLMDIIAKMEYTLLVSIDYSNFEISQINTLRKISDYINQTAR